MFNIKKLFLLLPILIVNVIPSQAMQSSLLHDDEMEIMNKFHYEINSLIVDLKLAQQTTRGAQEKNALLLKARELVEFANVCSNTQARNYVAELIKTIKYALIAQPEEIVGAPVVGAKRKPRTSPLRDVTNEPTLRNGALRADKAGLKRLTRKLGMDALVEEQANVIELPVNHLATSQQVVVSMVATKNSSIATLSYCSSGASH